MKKIIVGVFGFVLLFGAQNAFAATWNGASNDCSNISIMNATTNEGYSNPCWPASSVSVEPGEMVNVRIYYHNTGSVTANNTHIVLNGPTGANTTKSFTGRIVSGNGSLSFGPVSANLSSPQSLTFHSVKWYTANTNETLTPLLHGQTGQEVLTDAGLDIGSIAPGWATQGSVVIAFRAGNVVAPTPTCSISNFSANPSSVTSGQASNLSWSTSNCVSASISNLNYNIPTSGNQSVYPTVTTTYVLTATGANGNTIDRTTTVAVSAVPNPVCQDTQASNYGGQLPCNYPIRFCQDHSASNYLGLLPCNYPVRICYDSNASNYGSQLPCNYPVRFCQDRSASNYGYSLPCTYIASVCKDSSANNYNYSLPCTYNQPVYNYNTPTVSTYIPTNITNTSATLSGFANGNGSSINTWIEMPCYGTQYGNRYNYSSASISQTVNSLLPNTTYSYCAVAQNSNNSQIYRGNSVSFTTTGQYYVNNVVNKNVVTTVATNVTQTEAQINGYITNSNYYNSNVYFDYGTTVNLGSRTASKTTNGNTNFSDVLRGLTPNTIYFFQAVSEGGDGTARGSIEIFRTLGNGVITRNIVVQGTTVVGTASPVLLNISNRYESIGEGDLVDYVVTYKNIGKTKLVRPMVQVMLPINITLVNASRGTYSVDTHTLSSQIQDLKSGEEGTIFLQGRVDSIPANNSQIATTAILIYTNTNGSQENAMAYVINTPRVILGDIVNSNLGASAFFAGLLSIGFIGWLIIIIFILLLILIARSMIGRSQGGPVSHTPTH